MQGIDAANPVDRTSRLAGGAAILLASLTGLVAAFMFPAKPAEGDGAAEARLAEPAAADRMGPDAGRVISFCARHTSGDRGFVVFRNGTCVIIGGMTSDPVGRARRLLEEAASPDAKFLSERTAEGDLIVTFAGPVFHWLPSDELAATAVWAERNLDGLFSENERKATGENWMPPEDARLGLVARGRLLADSGEAEVLKVIMPKPSGLVQ